ncbi:MAG: carboxypeptidase-like regulatory domain-containing protein [Blastocatellia bacterium]
MRRLLLSFASHSVAACAVACLLLAAVPAQGIRAKLTGRVSDTSGAVVPGARITVTNTGTNESRNVASNEEGDYTLPQLAPGDYQLVAEMQGFKKVVQKFSLETGQDARVDVTLTTGAVTEQVEITATTPVISSEDAALGGVVDQKKSSNCRSMAAIICNWPCCNPTYSRRRRTRPWVFAADSTSLATVKSPTTTFSTALTTTTKRPTSPRIVRSSTPCANSRC